MKLPEKNRSARTGSSVKGDSQLAQHRGKTARQSSLLEKLARRHARQSRALISRADLRRLAANTNEIKGEWREASVRGTRDVRRVAALKATAQKKLRRVLARELPNYMQWRALKKAHLRERRTLLSATHAPFRGRLAWSDEVTRFADAQEFTAPFTNWYALTVDNLPDEPGSYYSDHQGTNYRDQSFAVPSVGHLVNDVVSDHDDFDFFFDRSWPYSAHCRASCGVTFVTPSAGRLRLGAVLRNFYSRVTLSLHDNFGLSSADLYVSLNLNFTIFRNGVRTDLPITLQRDGLISHGSELSSVWTDLDDSAPYTAEATTDYRLEANEGLTVLAGSEIHIESELNDMHSTVTAVQWWQLQKLYIGMTD